MKELSVWTVQQFAQNFAIKPATIYSWLHYKKLPSNLYRKLGNKPLFIVEEVNEWFMTGAKLLPACNNSPAKTQVQKCEVLHGKKI